jgi:hypothetical protein
MRHDDQSPYAKSGGNDHHSGSIASRVPLGDADNVGSNEPAELAYRIENSSCRSLGSSEEAGKPIAIVERAHAKLPVKCATKPPFVSKTALHGDLLEA